MKLGGVDSCDQGNTKVVVVFKIFKELQKFKMR
jgi:hypothetical protein